MSLALYIISSINNCYSTVMCVMSCVLNNIYKSTLVNPSVLANYNAQNRYYASLQVLICYVVHNGFSYSSLWRINANCLLYGNAKSFFFFFFKQKTAYEI